METLIKSLRQFAKERDWGQFHSPKNLSMALTKEAAELMEHFQWLTESGSWLIQTDLIEPEIGDVMIYLLMICDKLGIDPIECARIKLEINKDKYPIEKAKGNAKKYNEL